MKSMSPGFAPSAAFSLHPNSLTLHLLLLLLSFFFLSLYFKILLFPNMELGPRLLPENKFCLDLIWVSRNVIATVRNVVCMCARLVCLLFSWNHGIEQTMCFAECIFTDHVSWIKCCWVPSDLSLKSVLQRPKTWVPFWIWSFEPDGSTNLQRKHIILNNSGQLCVESPSEFDLFCKHGKERKVYSHLYAYRSWRKRKPEKQSL